MARLGPFEPRPRLAVAVSGGPDSMALALLAATWARTANGSVLALVVDHGLRPESDAEARLTVDRLAACGIASERLVLTGLARGPALAERARRARYAAMEAACRERGILHLLLGHQVADQAETVAMRLLRRSGPAGLAGMPALAETPSVRRLRPLLAASPGALRALLRGRGVSFIEDPSNRDPTAERARLRALRRDRAGDGPATRGLAAAAMARGYQRADADAQTAVWLARHAAIYPEGYAVVAAPAILPEALARLVQVIAGRERPVSAEKIAAWCADPRPATLGGAVVRPFRANGARAWLIAREQAAIAAPRPAEPGMIWDGRFRLLRAASAPATIGALDAEAAAWRGARRLPSLILRTLPAIRDSEGGLHVPHLQAHSAWSVAFAPPQPAAGAPFLPGVAVAQPPEGRLDGRLSGRLDVYPAMCPDVAGVQNQ